MTTKTHTRDGTLIPQHPLEVLPTDWHGWYHEPVIRRPFIELTQLGSLEPVRFYLRDELTTRS